MKLDMDLIREILLWCEERIPDETRSFTTDDLEIEGHTHFQIKYHVKLLADNGYLEVIDGSTMGDPYFYFLKCLTLDGYQFLALIKSDKVWKSIKEVLGKVGLAAIPVVMNLIAPNIKLLLGLP
jgi:hypothetical protein